MHMDVLEIRMLGEASQAILGQLPNLCQYISKGEDLVHHLSGKLGLHIVLIIHYVPPCALL